MPRVLLQVVVLCKQFVGQQDGPSLESSSYLNVSLRYLGPWNPGTLEPLDLPPNQTIPKEKSRRKI